jgi:hypothetical protein
MSYEISETVQGFLSRLQGLHINGQLRTGSLDQPFVIFNPSTGETLCPETGRTRMRQPPWRDAHSMTGAGVCCHRQKKAEYSCVWRN